MEELFVNRIKLNKNDIDISKYPFNCIFARKVLYKKFDNKIYKMFKGL